MLSFNDLVTALEHLLPRRQLTAEELADIIRKRHYMKRKAKESSQVALEESDKVELGKALLPTAILSNHDRQILLFRACRVGNASCFHSTSPNQPSEQQRFGDALHDAADVEQIRNRHH